jgi:hypothetical protein
VVVVGSQENVTANYGFLMLRKCECASSSDDVTHDRCPRMNREDRTGGPRRIIIHYSNKVQRVEFIVFSPWRDTGVLITSRTTTVTIICGGGGGGLLLGVSVFGYTPRMYHSARLLTSKQFPAERSIPPGASQTNTRLHSIVCANIHTTTTSIKSQSYTTLTTA